MEAIAKGKHQRIGTRKARVIANLIRGRNAAQAVEILRFTPKAAASVLGKVLDSAIANAKVKDPSVNLDTLVVKTAFVDMAPNSMMRRYRPRAQGRAGQITKGMSHITIVVGTN